MPTGAPPCGRTSGVNLLRHKRAFATAHNITCANAAPPACRVTSSPSSSPRDATYRQTPHPPLPHSRRTRHLPASGACQYHAACLDATLNTAVTSYSPGIITNRFLLRGGDADWTPYVNRALPAQLLPPCWPRPYERGLQAARTTNRHAPLCHCISPTRGLRMGNKGHLPRNARTFS